MGRIFFWGGRDACRFATKYNVNMLLVVNSFTQEMRFFPTVRMTRLRGAILGEVDCLAALPPNNPPSPIT